MQGDDRLVELIEWHFAALVSGNNMPHMSGDPRARLHPGQRRRLNDAARAALAALRQHRPDVAAVLGGWQPIETAPKDGTRVLLADVSNGEIIAAYMGAWMEETFSCLSGQPCAWTPEPTHWMPLPARPRRSARRDAGRICKSRLPVPLAARAGRAGPARPALPRAGARHAQRPAGGVRRRLARHHQRQRNPEDAMSDNSATLDEQIAEVSRECAMRERVYAGWVTSGRMKLADSQRQIRRMRAVLATLEKLRAAERAKQPELL